MLNSWFVGWLVGWWVAVSLNMELDWPLRGVPLFEMWPMKGLVILEINIDIKPSSHGVAVEDWRHKNP